MQKTVLLCFVLLFGLGAPLSAQLSISVEDYIEKNGDQVEIPISVENFDELYTVQLTFAWDNTVLEYVETLEPELVGWDINTYNDNTALSDGYVRVGWTDLTLVGDSMEDAAAFLTLRFNVIGNPGDSTFLTFPDSILPAQYGNINDTSPQIPSIKEGKLNVFMDVGTFDRPEDFGWEIQPCSPNPFSDKAIVAFSNPQPTTLKWSLFDLTGKLITTKHTAYSAGVNHLVLEQHLMTHNGFYLLRMETPDFIHTEKIEFFR